MKVWDGSQVDEVKWSCKGCGQHIAAPAGTDGQMIMCPECGLQNVVPSWQEAEAREANEKAKAASEKSFASEAPARDALPSRVPDSAEALRSTASTWDAWAMGILFVGALSVVVAVVMALAEKSYLEPASVAGGFLFFGLLVKIVAELIYLRAALERKG